MKYELKKPIEFDNIIVFELNCDFEDLSYSDIKAAIREAKQRIGKKESLNAVIELDKTYLACIVARAAKVKPELIFELKANDFTQITMQAQNFLLGGASEEEENLTEDSLSLEETY